MNGISATPSAPSMGNQCKSIQLLAVSPQLFRIFVGNSILTNPETVLLFGRLFAVRCSVQGRLPILMNRKDAKSAKKETQDIGNLVARKGVSADSCWLAAECL
jgi:hypothetical protein